MLARGVEKPHGPEEEREVKGGEWWEGEGRSAGSEATPTPAGKREKPSNCFGPAQQTPSPAPPQQVPAPGALSSGAETPGQETP